MEKLSPAPNTAEKTDVKTLWASFPLGTLAEIWNTGTGSNLQNTFSKIIKILSATADNNFRGVRFLRALPLCFSVRLDCGKLCIIELNKTEGGKA